MTDTQTAQSSAALKPQIDMAACNGHGRCYSVSEVLFDCDDDGYPLVIGIADTPELRRDLDYAVTNCPERAVSAVEA